MTAADMARRVFSEALDAIQRAARQDPSFWPAPQDGRGLRLDDLLGLRLEFKPGARGALFDHRVYERVFELYPALTQAYSQYWQAAVPDPGDQLAMCELFLLHELLHVGQAAHSDVYFIDGQSTLDLFAGVDYAADVQALRMAFEMRAAGRERAARAALWVRMMSAQLHGGAVFGTVDRSDPAAAAPASMEGARLRRQSVWALQYARAAAYLPESDGWGEALGERIEWQWLLPASGGVETSVDLCDQPHVDPAALAQPLRGHFTVGGRLVIRHEWLHPRERDALTALLFHGDQSRWNDAYRRLFDSHPFLTGRGPQGTAQQLDVADKKPGDGGAARHIMIDARGAQISGGGAVYVERLSNHKR